MPSNSRRSSRKTYTITQGADSCGRRSWLKTIPMSKAVCSRTPVSSCLSPKTTFWCVWPTCTTKKYPSSLRTNPTQHSFNASNATAHLWANPVLLASAISKPSSSRRWSINRAIISTLSRDKGSTIFANAMTTYPWTGGRGSPFGG